MTDYPLLKFNREFIPLIREGRKTQTRRKRDESDFGWVCGYVKRNGLLHDKLAYSQICHEDGSVRFERDAIYRVADEDGAPEEPPLLVRVVTLWSESSWWEIPERDAVAEGFNSPTELVAVLERIYGERPAVWVIEFGLVKQEVIS